jgi:hypothetical protein
MGKSRTTSPEGNPVYTPAEFINVDFGDSLLGGDSGDIAAR